MDWIVQNIGTIGVGLVVLGVVAAVAVNMLRKRKAGGCAGCSCGCENCPKKF